MADQLPFEKLPNARRHRAARRRVAAAVLGISVATAGSALAYRAFRPKPEEADRPVSFRVGSVTRYPLEHPPQPIAAGLGAAWALSLQTESEDVNTLYRLDPLTEEVREIDIAPANPEAVAVGEGFVWVAACETVRVHAPDCGGGKTSLLRLDPETGAVLERTPLPGHFADLSVGGGSVWVDAVILEPYRRVVIRIDAATQELSVRECCAGGEGFANSYSAGWLWGGLFRDNTVFQIDPSTLQIHNTFDDLCRISPWEAAVLAAQCDRRELIVGRLDPVSGRFISSPLRSEQYPFQRYAEELVATGNTGWFVERLGETLRVHRFDPDGSVGGPWRVPTAAARYSDFSIGPDPFFLSADAEDKVVWISDFQSGEVLRLAIEPAR